MTFFISFKERLQKWEKESSRKEKVLLSLISTLLPIVLFYKFYYDPAQEKTKMLQEDIKKLELEIKKLEDFVKREKEAEIQLTEREKFLEEVKLILPTEEEIPRLLREVSQTAKKHKLEIVLFSPKKEIPQDYYNQIPLDIQLKGTFKDILFFLNDIGRLPRLLTINKVEFSPLEKEEKVWMSINIATYQYTGKQLEKQEKK